MSDFIIKFLAEYTVYILIVLAGVLFLAELIKSDKSERIRKVVLVALAMATSLAIAQVAHLIPVEDSRPYQNEAETYAIVEHSDDSPFPSDHTLLAFALAFMVLFMTRYRKWGIAVLILACLVPTGRLLALVHSPLDVAGGIVIAGLGALWYLLSKRGAKEAPEQQ